MVVTVQCPCGRSLKARDEFAGKRGECVYCGRTLTIPSLAPAPEDTAATGEDAAGPTSIPAEEPLEITEFFDPPSRPVEKEPTSISLRPMLEALLDPRSIQWMLILGGGLTVLGLIVWLTSLGIFENKIVLAVALGTGTLVLLALGWLVVLKTRFKVAGQAVTFLACVLAPLNLWFYHAQGLITLDGHLWLGGVVCCLLYAATVYVLRDELFMYAVEAGVTLTVALLLRELVFECQYLSLALLALGLLSIHAERAFPPEAEQFTRQRFGMPLFWSGHVQLGLGLLVLLLNQITGWLLDPAHQFFETTWAGNVLTHSSLLAGGMWLAGMYAYLYSDIIVRRVGIYTYLAAFCLLLAEWTLAGAYLNGEGLIAVLALTAMAAILVQNFAASENEKINRAVPPLAMALSALPILIGTWLHLRATSSLAADRGWDYETGWWFVAVMLLVAACNRVSAFLYRRTAPRWSTAYFFIFAAAVIVAAAGLLRIFGLEAWAQQAPLLMLIPLGYLVASRLWRGHTPARPLYRVAQAATAVILLHVLVASQETLRSLAHPVRGQTANLLLGLVFAEAALFYTIATILRVRSINVYLATAAACAALWQWLGYLHVPGEYHTILYAAVGIGLLALARRLGLEQIVVYHNTGTEALATRGRGLPAFQTGNAVVSVALLAAFLQGLTRLASEQVAFPWLGISALLLTTAASGAATCMVLQGAWRRWYATTTIALAGLAFLTLAIRIDLTGWQKLEIFCVIVGIVLLAVSHAGRFRETTQEQNEMVTLGFWLGSLLATLPLLIATIYYRFTGSQLSLIDEIALLTVSVLMLLTGYSWQIKSTTFLGGGAFILYLAILLVWLGWSQQWAVGVYLAAGGVLIFACGIGLSVYREKLLELPERFAKREGVFRIMAWR